MPELPPSMQMKNDGNLTKPIVPQHEIQPAGSSVIFVGTPDSLTFSIPAFGFRRMALSMMIFAVIWEGMTLRLYVEILYTLLPRFEMKDLFSILFPLVFVAVGVFLGMGAIQIAFRKAVILATMDSLVFTQKGPFRSAEFQWKPEELQAICADYSGSAVNGRRLRELQIHPVSGKKRGLMDGRNDNELEWIAATLRAFYQLPAK
jgi:hypothetical protein